MKFKFKALSLILSLVMLLCAFASCANNVSSESESDTEKVTQAEDILKKSHTPILIIMNCMLDVR